MSENGGTGAGDGAVGGMPAADVKFLVTCLQNTTGGSVSVRYSSSSTPSFGSFTSPYLSTRCSRVYRDSVMLLHHLGKHFLYC